jgi:hypothetical protein
MGVEVHTEENDRNVIDKVRELVDAEENAAG